MLLNKVVFLVSFVHILTIANGKLVDCECGKPSTSTRILGGKESDSKSYPWMTALVSKSTGKVFCGASLINSQFVLTAGHCMMNQNPGSFSVVVGETEAASFPSSSKIFLPLRIVNHPLFSGSPDYNNDLSLIQLNREINLVNSSDTTTVCLPRTTMTTFSSPFTVIGWGYIRNGGPQATKLLEASVRQQNQNYCQRTYGATKYTSRHICASGPDRQGVCNGDSGGPLILKQGQKSFLLATVSYGVTCGDSRYPAVFTRTQPYLPWIFSVTRNMGDYCSK